MFYGLNTHNADKYLLLNFLLFDFIQLSIPLVLCYETSTRTRLPSLQHPLFYVIYCVPFLCRLHIFKNDYLLLVVGQDKIVKEWKSQLWKKTVFNTNIPRRLSRWWTSYLGFTISYSKTMISDTSFYKYVIWSNLPWKENLHTIYLQTTTAFKCLVRIWAYIRCLFVFKWFKILKYRLEIYLSFIYQNSFENKVQKNRMKSDWSYANFDLQFFNWHLPVVEMQITTFITIIWFPVKTLSC